MSCAVLGVKLKNKTCFRSQQKRFRFLKIFPWNSENFFENNIVFTQWSPFGLSIKKMKRISFLGTDKWLREATIENDNLATPHSLGQLLKKSNLYAIVFSLNVGTFIFSLGIGD